MKPLSEHEISRPVPGLVQSLAREVAVRVRDDLAVHDLAGVRPIHAPLLVQLLGGGRRAADLAEATGVSRQAVAQVVTTLERDGYITRAGDRSISFTPSGSEHAEGIVRRQSGQAGVPDRPRSRRPPTHAVEQPGSGGGVAGPDRR